jgi:hypothetical protein
MAKQRLTVAVLVGESAAVVATLFRSWRASSDPAAVDRFCVALRENALSLPIIYFCEWLDGWLMGDLVPGSEAVQGGQYQAACFFPEQALALADECGHQFPEQQWLASRLREAATGCGGAEHRSVVVVREVFGHSTTDEDVKASLDAAGDHSPTPDRAGRCVLCVHAMMPTYSGVSDRS